MTNRKSYIYVRRLRNVVFALAAIASVVPFLLADVVASFLLNRVLALVAFASVGLALLGIVLTHVLAEVIGDDEEGRTRSPA